MNYQVKEYQVTKFKNLPVALKELEPFITQGYPLYTGKPLKQLGNLLPREALGNLLWCFVLNLEFPKNEICFTSHPKELEEKGIVSDGVIVDLKTNDIWLTEHVIVPKPRNLTDTLISIETRVINSIEKKQARGGDYAHAKHLIVFLEDGRGIWNQEVVARGIALPILFEDIWVFGLQKIEGQRYIYFFTQLCGDSKNIPIWQIDIREDFICWDIKRVQ